MTDPILLSGGNPKIAKGDGDATVQAYIAAMPGWKQAVGRRLDRLITDALPGVRKAVKWNTPFYGADAEGWTLAFHCTTNYIKIAFFRGALMHPMPPVESKQPYVRYLHVFDDGAFNEAQFIDWVTQGGQLPSGRM